MALVTLTDRSEGQLSSEVRASELAPLEHLRPGVENSGSWSAAGASLHGMDAVILQMPPSGAEEWWSTEPELHSWDVCARPNPDRPGARGLVRLRI